MKQLVFKSYNQQYLHSNLCFAVSFLKKNRFKYKLIMLPVKQKSISLLKSPHVYKKFKEHFIRDLSKVIIETEYKNIQLLFSKLNINKNLINIEIK